MICILQLIVFKSFSCLTFVLNIALPNAKGNTLRRPFFALLACWTPI